MIVVVGEALMDLLLHPDGRLEATMGGGPFNAARTIARLGRPVAFLGRLSSDQFGRALREHLTADGVDVRLVVDTDDPTTLAVAELDADGQAAYLFYTGGTSAPGLTSDRLPGIATADAVHVGTLGLVLEPLATAVEAVIARAPTTAIVMVDLNARPSAMTDRGAWAARVERLLGRVDVVKASADDLRALRPDGPAHETAKSLVVGSPRVVLLTDGERSIHVVTARGSTSLQPPRIQVVDTVGAGDAFGGGFLAAWIGGGHGRSDLGDDGALADATMTAIRVASLTCTRPGAAPPTAAELAAWEPRG